MADTKVFHSPASDLGQTILFISTVALIVSAPLGLIIGLPIMFLNHGATIGLLIAILAVPVLSLPGMLIGIVLQAINGGKDERARVAWLSDQYGDLFTEMQVKELARGHQAYINDNGVTRDGVSFSDNPADDEEGEILVFKQESAYRTDPTPVG